MTNDRVIELEVALRELILRCRHAESLGHIKYKNAEEVLNNCKRFDDMALKTIFLYQDRYYIKISHAPHLNAMFLSQDQLFGTTTTFHKVDGSGFRTVSKEDYWKS